MGRKKQEGNYFFPVDVGFFSDRKIKILKARYGTDGLTIYMPYFFHKIPKTIEKLVRQEIGCCRAVVKTNTNRAIFIILEAFRNNTNRYKNEVNRLYRCRSL